MAQKISRNDMTFKMARNLGAGSMIESEDDCGWRFALILKDGRHFNRMMDLKDKGVRLRL